MYKLLASKDSPYSMFDIGNVETLKGLVSNTEVLRNYILNHYVTQNMYLVIYTSESEKETSKKRIVDIFSKIPDKLSPKFPPVVPVFNKKDLGVVVKIKDTSPIKEFTMSFNI